MSLAPKSPTSKTQTSKTPVSNNPAPKAPAPKPCRILQLGIRNEYDGVSSFIINHYRQIDRTHYQFDFLIPYTKAGPYDSEIQQLGGRIYHFSYKENGHLFQFCRQLNHFFKIHHYDIIHCHDTALGILYLYYAKKHHQPIRIVHSHAANVEPRSNTMIKNSARHFYTRYATHRFACSDLAGQFLFRQRPFTVVKNGIDYQKFKFNPTIRQTLRQQLHLTSHDVLIGNIGRLCEQKNQFQLIQTVASLAPHYHLLIIGDGPLQSTLTHYISTHRLSNRVHIISPTSHIADYYSAFDVFVLSSHFEGLPIVGLEAQANGLPCIFSSAITPAVQINCNVFFIDFSTADLNTILPHCQRTNQISLDYHIQQTTATLEYLYSTLATPITSQSASQVVQEAVHA